METAHPMDRRGIPHAGFGNKIVAFLEAIKVSHSVFALPFAVSAAFLAAGGWPSLSLLGKIVAAVILARTSAMSFNRWTDAAIDARNPRTAVRALPTGQLSRSFMAAATVLCAAGFVVVCGLINDLALALSPVTLLVLLGYSYTKRFTALSHLVLGTALGLSPIGGWVAVAGRIDAIPVVLGAAVVFWTSGFDIIYACQDAEFDRAHGLYSLPARLGLRGALFVSRAFHAVALGLLVTVGLLAHLGLAYGLVVAAVAALLAYEQSLVRPDDLSRVQVAFFALNGLVSLVFMAGVILDVVL